MVAGDRVDAVPRAQLGERGDLVAQVLDVAVDEIAGQHDQVRRQPVRLIDDVLDEVAVDRQADVEVGELDDREAVEGLRQPRERDLDVDDLVIAARLDHAARDAAGAHGHGRTAGDAREKRPS